MSSAAPKARRTRWIDPAGWPLRTRIVTTMIALLAVLGLVVGGTAELYLYNSLHKQVDTEVEELSRRIGSKPPGKGAFDKHDGQQDDGLVSTKSTDNLPGGIPRDALVLQQLTDGSLDGGVLQFLDTSPDPQVQALTAAAQTTVIAEVPADGRRVDVSVGDGLPQYRMKKVTKDGNVYYIGISLEESNGTLLQVALFTGCVILGSLIIAGWGGALIVRRTLLPLDRVAATATRVSELRLDRGEVQLAQRVPEQDTDPRTEVGQVGAALNRMLDHVGNALEARHASEMQVRQFVADASHELRTPLAAIRGYAELSRRSRKPVPDEIAHVLTRVESEAKRMTALVEDLLLLARLDAGRPLAQDPVDLTMLAVDAASDAHAAGPRHYWQLDLPEEPVTVIGDGARLHQVVANLLANARTHTPEGSTVTVKVGAVPNAAVVQVIDNGPGIQQDLVPRIFERFARGDSSRSRAAGSTGLGLSIVHAVVTSHRGKVGVQSRPGQTIFTVMLPLGPPPVVPTAEQRPQMLHPAR
ncbi:sensor histidine kinase [Actinoplanes derwentensis]|uniref:histidine kinase n=1 Tax=Actinoplanes derwentensis TaxID=113562 RepID=A0A1H2CMG6_9ACTN|nr:HAMP domain-containing sensor histidine kinase [Actinoplanes derwentensis]GID86195.1 two-component sensor histidine kinase [Actinoplanes derwentensis]SDT71735.1 two-component system, OmpR family, sensor kinase [Actinoplanes derwentensis]